MLSKYIITFLFIIAFPLFSLPSLESPPQEPVTKVIINMDNIGVLPRNFRTTLDVVADEESNPALFEGLHLLNASGSAQFSIEGLKKIQETIPSNHITIFDLRQESHGFVNGIAVSWRSEHNWANIGKTMDEVLIDEKGRLSMALEQGYLLITDDDEITPLEVWEIETEEQIAQSAGFNYIRLLAVDHWRPTDDIVDQFIDIIKSLPEDEWIHFHCAAGKGRTTTFISMLDMMRNARQVSFEDILIRQYLIGGIRFIA